MSDERLTDSQMAVVRFCAIACELQRSGERSVALMVEAWRYAQANWTPAALLTLDDVLELGAIVDPRNREGWRRVRVTVGGNLKMAAEVVPTAMDAWIQTAGHVDHAEVYREFEEIHPFVDGNGRTGQILFNWLSGTLDSPIWAPDFWADARRTPGAGA